MWLSDAQSAQVRALAKYEEDMRKYATIKAEWDEKAKVWAEEDAVHAALVAAAKLSGNRPPKGKTQKEKQAESKARAPPTEPKKPVVRMQCDEPYNFLRLATSLKILLGRSIDGDKLFRSAQLMQDYLLTFKQV